ncbi:MAG: VWA domain-containing protein [Gammaproteobacteria bacterium]|nr:VWA domain-containing protein [Gammaproteobacteria bacterium]
MAARAGEFSLAAGFSTAPGGKPVMDLLTDWLPADFHFLRPLWFVALLPLLLLLRGLRRRHGERGQWQQVCDVALLPYILIDRGSSQESRWSLLWPGLLGVLLITALAGPVWERIPQPLFRSQAAMVLLLDLSRSMDATDLRPSRLERARLKLQDLLKKRREGMTALIVFAAHPFVVSPLTDDSTTIEALLRSLSTEMMPRQGSHPEQAVALGIQLLQQSAIPHGQLVLVSDGFSSDSSADLCEQVCLEAAKAVTAAGHRLSVLAVGSREGSPIINNKSGEMVKDSNGAIVIARLQEAPLQQLAAKGNGIYSRLRIDDGDIEALLALDTIGKGDPQQAGDQLTERWREEGVWLTLFILPLLLPLFRRGVLLLPLLLLPLLLMSLMPSPLVAAEAQGSVEPSPYRWQPWLPGSAALWLNGDQRGYRDLQEENFQGAVSQFNDSRWLAAAHYRNGDYQAALKALEGVEDSETAYNRGNALARLGRLPEAIASYDAVLAADPQAEDARYNRDLLQSLLQQQQPQDNGDKGSQGESDSTQAQPQNGDKGGQDGANTAAEQGDPQSGSESNLGGEGESAQALNSAAKQQDAAQGEVSPDEASAALPPEAEMAGEDQPEAEPAEAEQVVESADNLGFPEGGAQDSVRQVEPGDLADEIWLKKIPDDPGGLLRRKFTYQYQQRYQHEPQERANW